jgi:hypothetical protein
MHLIKSRAVKMVTGFVGFALVLSFVVTPVTASAALSSSQVSAIISLLQSFGADQATINNVQASLTGGTPTPPPAGSPSTGYTFTRDLSQGSTGADVMNLQKVLNMSADTMVASSGAGSPGMETMTFGPATKAAVIKFQIKNGIAPAAGYVGSITRAKLNSMNTGGPTLPPPPPGGLPSGGALSVFAGQQPTNAIAVERAARVPFTKFTVTAGSSDVTINSVTVERVGLLENTAFGGVVLLDGNGMQIGVAKTLNSNNQTVVGEPFVVRAGTSQTLTVAGNMATDLNDEAGQVGGLNVVGVNTSASVSGSLPIMGAQHTMNSNLVIGTVTPNRGALDPNATADKEIGTTNHTFSSIKVDAGSAEDIRVWSIRWNQSGSASASDLANVKVYVDGVAYTTTVSADGKYYSASFPGGILIAEGLSKEISVKGDIVSGTNRTVAFDLYKTTDLYATGETFKYGITPATSGTGFSTGTPWYDAAGVVTIKAGSASTISSSNTVGAQNIAVLVSDQPLGGFEAKILGESINVGSMIFNLYASGNEVADITNIKLVNQNGAVLAGPEDGTDTTDPQGTVTFTNVTLPAGTTILKLVGRLNSDFVSGDTVQASTTPSTQWTSVTGQTTGDTVLMSSFSSPLTGSLMTVRAGALAISASTQPSARQVIAGAQGFEFARIVLDAGQSGEDVRLSNLKAFLTLSTITASQLSSCNLFDGTTNLTDATNVTIAAGANTFTFNGGGYVVSKGTSKTLSLKCNLATGATSGTVKWGIETDDYGSAYTAATGVTSGLTIAESVPASENLGQLMTAATSGSYTVTADSSLLYKMAQAGTSNAELARFRFTAGATEAVDLKQIALILGNVASNSPADLVGEKVTLWNGNTQIGTAQFGGASADHATSTLLSPAPRIAAGESVVITIRGDLSAQNVNEGTPGAFLAISYNGDNNGINGNYATGADSQTTVSGGTTGEVTSNGLRIFRTVPTIAVTSSGGTLGVGADLYKFTVTNPNSRDVVFSKFSFALATSGSAALNVQDFTLYGDGVAFNTTVADASGASGTLLEISALVTSQAKIVPANGTKTYILKTGSYTQGTGTDTLTVSLLADTSFPSCASLMCTVAGVEAGSADTDNIIWSPFSTTTPVATSATESQLDWVNGYGLPGFPSNTSFPVQAWTLVH